MPKKPKTYADHCAKRTKIWNEMLGSFIDLYKQPVDLTSVDKALKLILSYVGISRWLASDWNPDGTPRPHVCTIHERFVMRLVNLRPGFLTKILRFTKKERSLAFESAPCVTPDEALRLGNEFAELNGIRLFKDYRVRFEKDCHFEHDKTQLETLRSACVSRIIDIVLKGSKAKQEDLELMLGETMKPIHHYRQHEMQFNQRWNAEGKWIGPKKKKLTKPQEQETEVVHDNVE
jgi:hypothetical protein